MNIASYIDHTLLKPDATEDDIALLCSEAVDYSFASVCINPCRLPFACKKLENSSVRLCCVTGFPLGATSTAAKLAETRWCLDNGADEIDTVINIGECKAGNWGYVEDELTSMVSLVHSYNAVLKVIFENCLLESSEIIRACRASAGAGVDFIKTSTGFSSGGAKLEDVRLMAKSVDGVCKVKAAGGIRSYEEAVAMIDAGASRIGTSNGVSILAGKKIEQGY